MVAKADHTIGPGFRFRKRRHSLIGVFQRRKRCSTLPTWPGSWSFWCPGTPSLSVTSPLASPFQYNKSVWALSVRAPGSQTHRCPLEWPSWHSASFTWLSSGQGKTCEERVATDIYIYYQLSELCLSMFEFKTYKLLIDHVVVFFIL